MDGRTAIKLFKSSWEKFVRTQITKNELFHIPRNIFQNLTVTNQIRKQLTTGHFLINSSVKGNNELPLKWKIHFTQHFLFPNTNPDILFITNRNLLSVMQKKMWLNSVRLANFSSSTNHNSLWKKLVTVDTPAQVPIKLFTNRAEIEPLVIEGRGWAGQPIVKRIHPILPETFGDISDIVNPAKEVTLSAKVDTHVLTPSQFQTPAHNSVEKDCSKNHVKISSGNEELNNVLSKEVENILHPNKTVEEMLLKENTVKKMSTKLKESRNIKTGENAFHNRYNETFIKNPIKKKRKKLTKVCNSHTGFTLNSSSVKIPKKRRSKVKAFAINKKIKLQPQLALNQRSNAHSSPKNVMLMERRQLKTDTSSNYQKVSQKNYSKVKAKGKSKKKGMIETDIKGGGFDDNCECPQTSVVKVKRKFTKVCGKATGEGVKKRKEFKMKMCPIEKIVKQRRKTVVCASKIKKDRRKRELPKCVKPEKKPIPRVSICPPKKAEQLKGKSKMCEKQVEEVKIRKRTVVCKPVVIYGREVAEIKIEKTVCTEKKSKQTSRHTTVCEPPTKKSKKQAQMQ